MRSTRAVARFAADAGLDPLGCGEREPGRGHGRDRNRLPGCMASVARDVGIASGARPELDHVRRGWGTAGDLLQRLKRLSTIRVERNGEDQAVGPLYVVGYDGLVTSLERSTGNPRWRLNIVEQTKVPVELIANPTIDIRREESGKVDRR